MKQQDMIVLGLAAVAVYMIAKSTKGGKVWSEQVPAGLKGATATVTEVLDSAGQAFANGWRYFSDGTSIDPAGNYYQGGQIIWRSPATLDAARWSV